MERSTLSIKSLSERVYLKSNLTREFLAELLGTFVLVLIGDASVAQYVLSKGAAGSPLSVYFGWGFAVALGIYVAGGVTGGHINPAISLMLCCAGNLKWLKLPIYAIAQYLGAFIGAALVFAVYHDALNNFDPGLIKGNGSMVTAGIFATYPQDYVTTSQALVDQIVGTAILAVAALAITDHRNTGVPKYLGPALGAVVVGAIGMTYGLNCGYAINPARDFSPRVFTAMAGWGGKVFRFRGGNWFWVPIVGPHIGAIIGLGVYKLFVGLHWPREHHVNAGSHAMNTVDYIKV